MRTLLVISFLWVTTVACFGQCVAPVDFNTWIQEGPPANGTWIPGGGGSNVLQTTNGQPTFFVSPDTFINVTIQGSITVVDSDDDFVGFVFGYKQPLGNSTFYDMYLFDWKQGQQNAAPEGFTINKVTGNIPPGSNTMYFWDHTSDPTFTVLGTDFGAGKGWVTGFTHQVELKYTSSQIAITVDGNVIFDIPGCYDPGRFGFYNFSQAGVTYADFAYQINANYNLITPLICKNDTGQFQFVDTSCSGIPVNIASWEWDFGDGNTSTEMNPFHSYAASGAYPVQMIITDDAGCADSVIKTIVVQTEPNASFSSTQVCEGLSTDFTDNTTLAGGGAIASWSWDFGDANVSSVQNPANLYANYGTYNTLLTVTTDSGCTDTVTIAVIVNPVPVAGFTSADVCLYDIMSFTSTSTVASGTVSWYWDFDNGSTSTLENPTQLYVADGLYNITLVVTSNYNCTDTIMQTFEVFAAPIADFSAQSVCFGTSTVFTDQSSVVNDVLMSWNWIYGDGSPVDNTPSPSHLYTNSTTYSYPVTLLVTSASGCTDDTVITVLVHPLPIANFTTDTVCLNVASVFAEVSTVANNEAIASYAWDFGDGIGTSTTQSPNYTYSTYGTFDVLLQVVTDSGCTDDTLVTIRVDSLPIAYYSVIEVCPQDTTIFTDESTADVVSWLWNFDPGSSTLASPKHVYSTTGSYGVQLAVENIDGCVDTFNYMVTSYPEPTAGFTVNPDSTSQVTPFIDFTYNSFGATSYFWDMGDDSSFITAIDTGFTYIYSEEDTATYLVMQIATNSDGCRDTFERYVWIREDFTIFFPNSFTPNGDGINDVFLPLGIGLLSNLKTYKLSIFNRWGDNVFTTDDVHEAWDGTANNGKSPAQSTVFVWFVNMEVFGLGKHQAIGHVTLLR